MDSLPKLQGCEFVATLALEFIKLKNDNKTIYCTSYLNSKAETVINESLMDDIFESISSTIISNIQDHNTNISKYNPLSDRCYIKLRKRFD